MRVGDRVYFREPVPDGVALEERGLVREIVPEIVHAPGEVIVESVGAVPPWWKSLPTACGPGGGLGASPEVPWSG